MYTGIIIVSRNKGEGQDGEDLILHEWQAECLNTWERRGYRGIVNAVTGSGKTTFALTAISHIEEKINKPLRVKIVVPQTFLVAQWKDEIRSHLIAAPSEIGVYSGKRKDFGRRFMIYVVNSARYSLAGHILADIDSGFAVLLIADECHHYGSAENNRIFEFYKIIGDDAPYYTLGLSATPEIVNYKAILGPIGPEIYYYDLVRALKDRIISRFILFSIRLGFTHGEGEEYLRLSDDLSKSLAKLKSANPELRGLDSGVFFAHLQKMAKSDDEMSGLARTALILMIKRRALCHLAAERPSCVISIVKMLPEYCRIILFCERIETVELIYSSLSGAFPDQTGVYHSKMTDSEKQDMLNRFSRGTFRMLICCKALDEGLNIPSIDAGIIVSSSSSARQRVQRIGRMLRHSKEIKRIYYLYIGESNEDGELVLGLRTLTNAVPTITLRYRGGLFVHTEYKRLRDAVLGFVSARRDEPVLVEAMRGNLDKALLRGDFLVHEQTCRDNIQASRSVAERNYWVSVLYLILARQGRL